MEYHYSTILQKKLVQEQANKTLCLHHIGGYLGEELFKHNQPNEVNEETKIKEKLEEICY